MLFQTAISWKNIYVSKENEYFSSKNGILYNKEGTEIVIYPPGRRDREFIIPNGVTSTGKGCFSTNKYLERIIVPSSVSRIGESAFSECSINSISLPDNLESIEKDTFFDCSDLSDIKLPKNLRRIEDGAFSGCKIEGIDLPLSLISIGNNAFSNCTNLVSVTLPSSLRSIGGGVFSLCDNLRYINVSKDSEYFMSIDGVLFDKKKEKLIGYPIGRKRSKYIVPKGVKEIGDGAFQGSSLKKVKFPYQ